MKQRRKNPKQMTPCWIIGLGELAAELLMCMSAIATANAVHMDKCHKCGGLDLSDDLFMMGMYSVCLCCTLVAPVNPVLIIFMAKLWMLIFALVSEYQPCWANNDNKRDNDN